MSTFDNIVWLLQQLINITWFIMCCGFVYYQWKDDIKSWEQGIKEMIPAVLIGVIDLMREDTPANAQLNSSLVLSVEELNTLSHKLNGNPYQNILFESGAARVYGTDTSVYTFSAYGLAKEFKELQGTELQKYCEFVIRQFYKETRGASPYIQISVAAPTRLQVEVALSQRGQHQLMEKQRQFNASANTPNETSETLEETFDLFGDDVKDGSGI